MPKDCEYLIFSTLVYETIIQQVPPASAISKATTVSCVIRKTLSICQGCRMPEGQKHIETEYHVIWQCPRHRNSRPPQSCYEDLNDRTQRGVSENADSRCPQCQARPRRGQVRAEQSRGDALYITKLNANYGLAHAATACTRKLTLKESKSPAPGQ